MQVRGTSIPRNTLDARRNRSGQAQDALPGDFPESVTSMHDGARAEDTEALAGFDEGPLPNDWIGELERRGIRVIRDLRRDAARKVLASYITHGGQRY